ncbi:non-specific lipid-transfer protein 2-like [Dorcoceras hygrometricum]|uniref:Non-specific lipid-transfer protein n=1 Tax=Dorcoceras hygrometricum TaxID=472368 RepID=A0A2Z7CWI6_9LAMI|nr:non-specific lipid-transfer protein 2-like [Dorcoceras hygrometricum]
MDSRVVLSVIVVLAVVQFFAQPGYAVTCGEVDVALLPCIGYLRGSGADPTPACCDGVKAVKGMGQTPADKKACCNCVKAAANRYPDLKDAAAQSLPAKCGVQLDIPISRSVDCDKYV